MNNTRVIQDTIERAIVQSKRGEAHEAIATTLAIAARRVQSIDEERIVLRACQLISSRNPSFKAWAEGEMGKRFVYGQNN